MIRRVILTVLLLGLLFGAYFGWKTYKEEQDMKAMSAMKPPPTTVSTATASEAEWQQTINTSGTLKAEKGVTLDAHAPGVLTKVLFSSGQEVSEGDILVKMDDRVEQAQLKSAMASIDLARVTLKMKTELRKKNLISTLDFDLVQEQFDSNQAELERIQALIEHKLLKAPFSGTLGLRNIEVGSYLPAGGPMVEIRATRTMRLRFFVPERNLSNIQLGGLVRFQLDSYPGEEFKATISATEITLTEDTRALEVEAIAYNPDGRLMPGLFASVRMPVGKPEKHPSIPDVAVVYSLYGDSVYVVAGKPAALTVNRRVIKTGQTQAGRVQVIEGLKVGEEVVVAGQGKLHEGVAVKIDNSVLPVQSIKAVKGSGN